MSQQPNVLVFIPHDLGDFLGCYGHQDVKSPNLDSLASEGVRFSSYFTAAPECTPSRAGMYTGLYTHQNGLMGLCHRGWEFSHDTVHLAERLKEGGYRTRLFGLQHETHGDVSRLGYEEHLSADDRHAPVVCSAFEEFLESPEAEAGPWYSSVGFFDVHRPWPDRTSFELADIDLPHYLPDTPEVRKDYAWFYQNILEMDEAIGRVLDTLERRGLADNTIVIFTTDHGSPFPRAKSTYYDAGIRIPLIMRYPAAAGGAGGIVRNELLSNLDFTPTILDLCGIPVPEGLEGRSFSPLLAGGDYTEREAIFGALYYDAYYDPIHCVRTRRHKYIRSFAVAPSEAAGADPEVLARHETGSWIRADDSDVQNSDTWRALASTSWPVPPAEELYDLESDPFEERNLLAAEAGAPEAGQADGVDAVASRMRSLLDAMMRRTSSPLLTGHVSPDLSTTRNQRVNQG